MRDDLLVKKIVTPLGHTLYVVLGFNGLASAIEKVLAQAIPSQPGHGDAGVWVLREQDACAVVARSREA